MPIEHGIHCGVIPTLVLVFGRCAVRRGEGVKPQLVAVNLKFVSDNSGTLLECRTYF